MAPKARGVQFIDNAALSLVCTIASCTVFAPEG